MNMKRNELGLRPMSFETSFTTHPDGSCLVRMGNTWVMCTASVEHSVPPWLQNKNQGWVTAEYSMLPAATHSRTKREAVRGKQSGRTQEIQRLIGRALRACIDLTALGERTILIDCDVIQADGGTRTASINGAFVALALAVQKLQKNKAIATSPIKSAVAAISLGLKSGKVLVDLDYEQDSKCDVDMNFVMLEESRIVELQGTAEHAWFSAEEAQNMLAEASKAIEHIIQQQKEALA